jgi:hypothetical protein
VQSLLAGRSGADRERLRPHRRAVGVAHRAVKVMVRSVRREAGQVLIDPRADSRIGGGETVVVEGVQRLREGQPVQIVGMRQVAPAQPAASSPVSEG